MSMVTLCVDCRFYEAHELEREDTCTHLQAVRFAVRRPVFHSCEAMRVGICREAKLFEPAQMPDIAALKPSSHSSLPVQEEK